ncbi:hypothetical protein AB0D38_46575 [Streptomyces sp. NPDC048279]|uniref:hypothetical protein n=1 Tax=Streptomyces sp. NPDC048279 TaxID=3154714 RepID=UPI003423A661
MKRRRRAVARGVGATAIAALLLGTPVQYAASSAAAATASGTGSKDALAAAAPSAVPGASALGPVGSVLDQ